VRAFKVIDKCQNCDASLYDKTKNGNEILILVRATFRISDDWGVKDQEVRRIVCDNCLAEFTLMYNAWKDEHRGLEIVKKVKIEGDDD
jgi:hypothetical protein